MANYMPETAGAVSPYLPLKSTTHGDEDDEIRLLSLAPGSFDDKITVTLTTHAVEELPDYEALSYVWGQSICETPAEVNGFPLRITEKLGIALRHLRHGDKARIMWIDALCINQTDIQERSSQVRIMASIYSRAWQVIIWLGPASNNSDFTMSHFSSDNDDLGIRDPESPHYGTKAIYSPYFIHHCLQLLTREWFNRVWVLQESLLASYALVQCGDKTTSLRAFHSTIRDTLAYCRDLQFQQGSVRPIWKHAVHWKRFVREINPGELSAVELALLDQYPENETQEIVKQALLLAAKFQQRAATVGRRPDSEPGSQEMFQQMITETAHLRATDPRDKVYGILSISRFYGGGAGRRIQITPDYGKSTAEVFAEAMASIILGGFQFGYPKLLLHADRMTCVPGLPSWVPNLAPPPALPSISLSTRSRSGRPTPVCPTFAQTEEALYPFIEESLYHPANDDDGAPNYLPQFHASFSPDYKILYTPGIFMGKISAFCKLTPQPAASFASASASPAATTNHLRWQFIKLIRSFFRGPGHDVPESCIWRILIRDYTLSPTPWSLKEVFHLLYTMDKPPDDALHRTEPHEMFWRDISECSLHHTVFLTDTGFLGMVDKGVEVRVGDEVVGLFGIVFPGVLRKVGGEGAHTIVNVAFVLDHRVGPVGTEGSALGMYGDKGETGMGTEERLFSIV